MIKKKPLAGSVTTGISDMLLLLLSRLSCKSQFSFMWMCTTHIVQKKTFEVTYCYDQLLSIMKFFYKVLFCHISLFYTMLS